MCNKILEKDQDKSSIISTDQFIKNVKTAKEKMTHNYKKYENAYKEYKNILNNLKDEKWTQIF